MACSDGSVVSVQGDGSVSSYASVSSDAMQFRMMAVLLVMLYSVSSDASVWSDGSVTVMLVFHAVVPVLSCDGRAYEGTTSVFVEIL